MTLNDNQKAWVASSIQTFVATFLTVIASTVSGGIEWTSAFWIGLVITGARAAIKAIFQQTAIPILGGKK